MKISDPTPTQKTLTEKPQKENHTTDKSLTPRQQYEQLRQERYQLMTDKKKKEDKTKEQEVRSNAQQFNINLKLQKVRYRPPETLV